jgi:hypothetical protein
LSFNLCLSPEAHDGVANSEANKAQRYGWSVGSPLMSFIAQQVTANRVPLAAATTN